APGGRRSARGWRQLAGLAVARTTSAGRGRARRQCHARGPQLDPAPLRAFQRLAIRSSDPRLAARHRALLLSPTSDRRVAGRRRRLAGRVRPGADVRDVGIDAADGRSLLAALAPLGTPLLALASPLFLLHLPLALGKARLSIAHRISLTRAAIAINIPPSKTAPPE